MTTMAIWKPFASLVNLAKLDISGTQVSDLCESKFKQLLKRPSDEILLKLYSLYRQANEGNIRGRRPG